MPEPVFVPWLRLISPFATAPKIIARMLPRTGRHVKPRMPKISDATAHPLDFLLSCCEPYVTGAGAGGGWAPSGAPPCGGGLEGGGGVFDSGAVGAGGVGGGVVFPGGPGGGVTGGGGVFPAGGTM